MLPATHEDAPLLDANGNHWAVHGPTVFLAEEHTRFAAFGGLDVYSQLKRAVYTQPTVLLTCSGSPCHMLFHMSAPHARTLAANLLAAAARVEEVAAALAEQPA